MPDKSEYYKTWAVYYRNRARIKKCRAAVHIEDKNDQPFWTHVFQQYMPHESFDFIPYTRIAQNKETGSNVCLKYRDLGCLSQEFLIAIDSDERYLFKEKKMDAVHYVLQTYTYSIENHYCNPLTVNRAFLLRNRFENTSFDFERFLRTFSRTIYPSFIYYLYSEKCRDGIVGKKEFIKLWDLAPPMIIDIDAGGINYLKAVKELTDEKIEALKCKYPAVSVSDMEDEFKTLGLMPDNTCLYVRGHNLFDKLITSIMKTIYGKQIKEYMKDLPDEEKSKYSSHRPNTTHEYFSQSLQYDYPEMEKIGEDIKSIFLTN
ncbi:MAG: DUF4435 domain-containing protein [Tannerellaceae bacterium]|jgi:hypothetical protein|nr:DUF4435 domain-containing protein [Tannerellaceae bacterium]